MRLISSLFLAGIAATGALAKHATPGPFEPYPVDDASTDTPKSTGPFVFDTSNKFYSTIVGNIYHVDFYTIDFSAATPTVVRNTPGEGPTDVGTLTGFTRTDGYQLDMFSFKGGEDCVGAGSYDGKLSAQVFLACGTEEYTHFHQSIANECNVELSIWSPSFCYPALFAESKFNTLEGKTYTIAEPERSYDYDVTFFDEVLQHETGSQFGATYRLGKFNDYVAGSPDVYMVTGGGVCPNSLPRMARISVYCAPEPTVIAAEPTMCVYELTVAGPEFCINKPQTKCVYSLFKDPECQHKVQRTQFQSVALRSAGGGCNTLFPRNGAVKYNQNASAVKYNLDGPEITGTFYDKRDCTGAEMPLRDTVVGQCTKSFKKYHGTEKWYTVSCS